MHRISSCVFVILSAVVVIGTLGAHVGAQKGLPESLATAGGGGGGGIASRKLPPPTTTKRPVVNGLVPKTYGPAPGGRMMRSATNLAAGTKQPEQPSQNTGQQKNKPAAAAATATEKPKTVVTKHAAVSRNNAPPLPPTKKPAGDAAVKKSPEPVANDKQARATDSGKKPTDNTAQKARSH